MTTAIKQVNDYTAERSKGRAKEQSMEMRSSYLLNKVKQSLLNHVKSSKDSLACPQKTMSNVK